MLCNRLHCFSDGLPDSSQSAQGAFSVAAKAKVPIVPVTLVGTGKLMPNGQEGRMYSGPVRMIVHKPIQPGKPDEMMREAQQEIASCLSASAVA